MPTNPYEKNKHPKKGRFKDENSFEQWVIAAAKKNGWMVSSMHDSRKQAWNTDAGFPDLVLTSQGSGRIFFIELKVHPNRLTPAQKEWAAALGFAAMTNPGVQYAEFHDYEEDEIIKYLGGKHPLI